MKLKYVQIIILASVFGLQFLFEHLYPQRKEINNWKNERFNVLIGFLNVLLTAIPAYFMVQWLYFIEENRFGILHQFRLPFWLQLAITILITDLWMYTWHRLNHRVRFLWQFHSFHHKDTKMNSTTALRFHIVELFLSYPGKALVCFVFGIGYVPLLIYEIAFFIAVVIHHSNMYINPRADALYRSLFASPLMHRIHHSIKFEETDSNFGALFSFWDRLFKSWTPGDAVNVEFGLPEPDGLSN